MSGPRDAWDKAEIISKIIAALFLPVVLLVMGTWIARQQKEADLERIQAENNANRLTNLISYLSSENPRVRLMATKMAKYFAEKGQLPNEIVQVLIEVVSSDPNKQVSESAIQSLKTFSESGNALAPDVKKALSILPDRVYIQIANEKQREKAGAIQEILKQSGFTVPGIENITGKAIPPGNTNVRYFSDQDQPTAMKIAEILKSNGIEKAYASRISGLKANPGTLEIWFAAND